MNLTRKQKVIEALKKLEIELPQAPNKDLWLRSVKQITDKYLGAGTQLKSAWYSEINASSPNFRADASDLLNRSIRHIETMGLYREGNFLRNVSSEVLTTILISAIPVIFFAGDFYNRTQSDKKIDKQDLKIDSLRSQISLYKDSLKLVKNIYKDIQTHSKAKTSVNNLPD